MSELPTIDWSDPKVEADPHAKLREVRAQSDVVHMLPANILSVLNAAECNRLLRDPRLGAAGTRTLEVAGITQGPIWDWWRLILFQTNPPAHTRLRSILSRAFTPRRADGMRGRVRTIAEKLVAEADDGVLDVEGRYAHEIPVRIISEMIGASMDDHAKIGQWSNDLGLAFAFLIPSERVETIEAALDGLYGYVGELVSSRRRDPGDDLISALIEAEEAGDRLDEDELRAMVVNLVFAGHDTTKGLISIALKLLADHPGEMAKLAADPSLIESAVEEVLRFEPVVPGLPRVALEPLEVGGLSVAADEFLSLSILAANRDPAIYERPDEFDISRGTRDHLSFGRGAHFCLGAALARVEAQEAVAAVARRARKLEIVGGPPKFIPFTGIRRYQELRLQMVE